jgi:signal transduction histidine kinase
MIERVEFNLEQLFAELTHNQQFQANKKGLKLELVKECVQQEKVVGDPHRIIQILNNLLSNAFKFTELGSIIVEYGLNTLDDHLRLSVVVTDTGIGVSDTSLPFRLVHSSRYVDNKKFWQHGFRSGAYQAAL